MRFYGLTGHNEGHPAVGPKTYLKEIWRACTGSLSPKSERYFTGLAISTMGIKGNIRILRNG